MEPNVVALIESLNGKIEHNIYKSTFTCKKSHKYLEIEMFYIYYCVIDINYIYTSCKSDPLISVPSVDK